MSPPIRLGGAAALTGASGSSIGRREFIVNGTSIRSAGTAPGDFYADWSPSRPGEYYVQGKITLRDGTVAVSDPVRVCIVTSLSGMAGIGGYLGPCPLATQVPAHASSGDIHISVIAAPNPIVFSTNTACPISLPSVTFVAHVDDPQDLVALVMVNFFNTTGTSDVLSYLNWITTRPVNQKEYRITVQIPDAFASDPAIPWFIRAYGRRGELLQVTQGFIPITQAQCSNQSLQIASSITLTPAITPTLTLTPTPILTPTPAILYIASPTKKPQKNTGHSNPPAPPTQPCNPLVRVCP